MKGKLIFILLILVSTLFQQGCSYIAYALEMAGADPNLPEKNSYHYEKNEGVPQLIDISPRQDTFNPGDSIEGIFYNNLPGNTYLVSPNSCPNSNLQKWDDENWSTVILNRGNFGCLQIVRSRQMEYGAERIIKFPMSNIQNPEGLYRFTLLIKNENTGGDYYRIYSKEFKIIGKRTGTYDV